MPPSKGIPYWTEALLAGVGLVLLLPLLGLAALLIKATLPGLPAVRLARLAVDRSSQGYGYGGFLLAEAIRRTLLAALPLDAGDDDSGCGERDAVKWCGSVSSK